MEDYSGIPEVNPPNNVGLDIMENVRDDYGCKKK
jgi:hypothetical protein